jgi:DNA replication protein DnaC
MLHQIRASVFDSHGQPQKALTAAEVSAEELEHSSEAKHLTPPDILLIMGRIGTGKTTLLRDMARYLADDCGLSVVVVDTHGDMGGGCPQCLQAAGCCCKKQCTSSSTVV